MDNTFSIINRKVKQVITHISNAPNNKLQFNMVKFPPENLKNTKFILVRNQTSFLVLDMRRLLAYKFVDSDYPFDTWSYTQVSIDQSPEGKLRLYAVEHEQFGLVRRFDLQPDFI
mmetsp:Transcript_1905/g.1818  ORF Transcript_1905/g.1818 Transcript_1905/m.1818 type:complete len:115 (-) Transcript_1905:91-435(-)